MTTTFDPNSMPFVHPTSEYANVDMGDSGSIHQHFYPPGNVMPNLSVNSLLGLGGLGGLGGFGGGMGGGNGGGMGGGGNGGYWWAPPNYNAGYAGSPVGQPLSALLDQQPDSFWNGVVDKQHLGLGRIAFPGTSTGGGSYGQFG